MNSLYGLLVLMLAFVAAEGTVHVDLAMLALPGTIDQRSVRGGASQHNLVASARIPQFASQGLESAVAQLWNDVTSQKRSIAESTTSFSASVVSCDNRQLPKNFTFKVHGVVPAGEHGFGNTVVGVDGDENVGMLAHGVLPNGKHVVHITIRDNAHLHKVHYHQDGGYVMQITDSSKLPNELEPLAGPQLLQTNSTKIARGETMNARRQCSDDGSVIDVAIFHTTAAASQWGSSEAVKLEAATTIAEISTVIYPASGIPTTLRLCANELLPSFTEDPSALNMLTAFHSDRTVNAIVANNKCDARGLFTSDIFGCGIGYRPGTSTVTAGTCFKDNYSFAHELGHNLGACHGAPPASGSCQHGGNGYGDSVNDFRTIMAYQSICGSGKCTRIARFSSSSSSVNWRGFPIGTLTQDNAATMTARLRTLARTQCSNSNTPPTSSNQDASGTCTDADSISTTYSSYKTVFFDISASQVENVTGFDVELSTSSAVSIHYKIGSYAGSENVKSHWKPIASSYHVTVPRAMRMFVPVAPLSLTDQHVYGIAISVDSGYIPVRDIATTKFSGEGNSITITSGTALHTDAFTGKPIPHRAWIGCIYTGTLFS